MKNFIFACLTLGLFSFSNAQLNSAGIRQYSYTSNSVHTDGYERLRQYDKKFKAQIKQTNVFDWHEAIITSGDKSSKVIARYNPIDDTVEIKNGERIELLAKRQNTSIKFPSKNLEYVVRFYYGSDDKIYSSYFIKDESLSMPLVLRKEYYDHFHSKQYSSYEPINFRFVKEYNYYVIGDDNKLYKLTTNKKTLRDNYPEIAEQLISFIKKQKIRTNPEDMQELARYIKSIA